MAIREIKRLTIVQQVVDGLKEYIMNGDIQVGDKLPTERELCQEFGVGRGTVREAVRTLQALGFTLIPSCGACLSNMAVAPDGTVLPCQSWLSGPGLGDILHQPWQKIWNGSDCRRIRRVSARMEHLCQLGDPRRPKEDA